MNDDIRAKFEGWYAKDINPLESFDKNADGTYGSYFLRLSWQGYQQAVKDMTENSEKKYFYQDGKTLKEISEAEWHDFREFKRVQSECLVVLKDRYGMEPKS